MKPKQKITLLGEGNNLIKVRCPYCKSGVYISRVKHYKCQSFTGICRNCNWKFQLKDTEWDYLQPTSPFYEMVYNQDLEGQYNKNKKKAEKKEEERKLNLEKKYYKQYSSSSSRYSFVRPWEKTTIEKEVLK